MISRRTLELAALACKAQALAAPNEADALTWERAALDCANAAAHLLLTATPPPAPPMPIPTLPPDVWGTLAEVDAGIAADLDNLDAIAAQVIPAVPMPRMDTTDDLDF